MCLWEWRKGDKNIHAYMKTKRNFFCIWIKFDLVFDVLLVTIKFRFFFFICCCCLLMLFISKNVTKRNEMKRQIQIKKNMKNCVRVFYCVWVKSKLFNIEREEGRENSRIFGLTVELRWKEEDEKNENDSVAWLNSIRCNNNNIAGSFSLFFFPWFITTFFSKFGLVLSALVLLCVCVWVNTRSIETQNKKYSGEKKTSVFALRLNQPPVWSLTTTNNYNEWEK